MENNNVIIKKNIMRKFNDFWGIFSTGKNCLANSQWNKFWSECKIGPGLHHKNNKEAQCQKQETSLKRQSRYTETAVLRFWQIWEVQSDHLQINWLGFRSVVWSMYILLPVTSPSLCQINLFLHSSPVCWADRSWNNLREFSFKHWTFQNL